MDAGAKYQDNCDIVASSLEVIRNIIDAMLQNVPVADLSLFMPIDSRRFRRRMAEEVAALPGRRRTAHAPSRIASAATAR
jgi:predicted nucleotide-binding protein (sugar kinase/HSP70/actin superfamily)